MSEDTSAGKRNAERKVQIELGVKGMRRATARMADDLRKAPRKKYPRQYAESAINDAEFVVEGEREIAQAHIERLEFAQDSDFERNSFVQQLDIADVECAEMVSVARTHARDHWPIPMD